MTTKRFNGIIRLDVRDSRPDWEPDLAPKAADARRAIRHYVAHQEGGTAGGVPPYVGFTHLAPTMKTLADCSAKAASRTRSCN